MRREVVLDTDYAADEAAACASVEKRGRNASFMSQTLSGRAELRRRACRRCWKAPRWGEEVWLRKGFLLLPLALSLSDAGGVRAGGAAFVSSRWSQRVRLTDVRENKGSNTAAPPHKLPRKGDKDLVRLLILM